MCVVGCIVVCLGGRLLGVLLLLVLLSIVVFVGLGSCLYGAWVFYFMVIFLVCAHGWLMVFPGAFHVTVKAPLDFLVVLTYSVAPDLQMYPPLYFLRSFALYFAFFLLVLQVRL